jgi:WD40 repeat protein
LLTLRPAFHERDRNKLIRQITEGEPSRLSRVNQAIPRDLETVVHKAMDRDPAHRYPTATDLAADLQHFLDDEPIRARRTGELERLARWCRHNRAVTALAAALLLVLVAVATGATAAAVRFKAVADAADAARDREKVQRERAEGLAEEDRANLYAARIHVAHQAWESGDVGRTLQLLDSLRPVEGQTDLRGFEWYYLWRLCHSERRRFHHAGPVRAVAYSPDGRTLATAGNDKTVRLWDPATGNARRALTGHTDWVTALCFSPDGRTLATASADRTVRLWDPFTGEERARLPAQSVAVAALAFSPDGGLLAFGTSQVVPESTHPLGLFGGWQGGEVKLWDLASGAPPTTLPGHRSGVLSLAFAPDGQTLASASGDHTVKLWDLSRHRERATLEGHTGAIFAVAFAPDGQTLATGSIDQTARLWDAATGEARATLRAHTGPVLAVAFAPRGRILATAGADQVIKLWGTADHAEHAAIRGHVGYVWSLAFAGDGRSLATASWDGTTRVWDVTGHQPYDWLATSRPKAAFSPDGRTVALHTGAADLKLYDLASGRERRALGGDAAGVEFLSFSPDGRTLATTGQTPQLWDTATGRCRVCGAPHPVAGWAPAFSPDGRLLATGGRDEFIKLWDPDTGTERARWSTGGLETRSLTFSPDGRTLAACVHTVHIKYSADAPRGGTQPELGGGGRSEVQFWDVATGQRRNTLRGHENFIEWFLFTPDAQTGITGGWDRTIKVWDLAGLKEKHTLKGHLNNINEGALTPDGRTLATASWDGSIKLWSTATWQELLSLPCSATQAIHVAFSPDGRTLASTFDIEDERVMTVWRGDDPGTGPAVDPPGALDPCPSDPSFLDVWA